MDSQWNHTFDNAVDQKSMLFPKKDSRTLELRAQPLYYLKLRIDRLTPELYIHFDLRWSLLSCITLQTYLGCHPNLFLDRLDHLAHLETSSSHQKSYMQETPDHK